LTKYVKPKEAAEILGVHERTGRRWEEDGRIEAIRTPSGQRRYNIESNVAKSGGDRRKVVVYASFSLSQLRVYAISGLERRFRDLPESFAGYRLYRL
jgi:excisionase family DNA binding protein